jgi:hypothetical protein
MDTSSTPSFTPVRGLVSVALLVFLLIVVYDALFYHGLLTSASRSVGPSKNWLAKPYTNLRDFGKTQVPTRTGNTWGFSDVRFSRQQFRNILRSADKQVDTMLGRHIKP